MKKNVAGQTIGAQMVSATDGSAITAGTVSVSVTGDAGAQGAGGGTVVHEGNGYYSYAPTQAETNFDHVAFTFTHASAIPVTVQVYTTFPQTGDSFGRLGAPAGASIAADLAAIEAQTDDIGVAGAGLTALGDARLANLDATVSSRATQASVDTIDNLVDDLEARLTAARALLLDNLDAAVSSRSTLSALQVNAEVDTALVDYDGPTFAELDARTDAIDAALLVIDDFLDTEIAAIKAQTDQLAFTAGKVHARVIDTAAAALTNASFAVGAIDALAVATDAWIEAADTVLDRNLASGTDSGTEAVRTVRQALRVLRNRVAIAAGVMTVRKEDDATASWTAAVTTAAGDPITEVNPT